jgi:hypothetical protein
MPKLKGSCVNLSNTEPPKGTNGQWKNIQAWLLQQLPSTSYSKLGDWIKLQTPLHKEYKNKIESWKASAQAFNQKSPRLQL